jgi:hypothetical protein
MYFWHDPHRGARAHALNETGGPREGRGEKAQPPTTCQPRSVRRQREETGLCRTDAEIERFRFAVLRNKSLSALPMPIVPTSLIKRPTAILSNILMIVVISLTAVPSVLHAVALRRGVCEFPGGCCIKSLRLKKKQVGPVSYALGRPPRRCPWRSALCLSHRREQHASRRLWAADAVRRRRTR